MKTASSDVLVRKRKSIVIGSDTARRLEDLMQEGESYHKVIVRILDHYETCPRERCPRKG